jgi:hypothetical protein
MEKLQGCNTAACTQEFNLQALLMEQITKSFSIQPIMHLSIWQPIWYVLFMMIDSN